MVNCLPLSTTTSCSICKITDNLVSSESLYIDQNYVSFLCSPTRAQMLTGRYASHLGLQHEVFQENMPYSLTRQVSLLSNELQSNGYSTHLIGKYHLGFQSWEYTPTYRGFDTFSGFYSGEETYFSHMAYVKDTDLIYYDLRENEDPDPDIGTYSVYLQTSKFLNLLETLSDSHDSSVDTPFFIYVAFQAAHFPPQAPYEYTSLYCDPSFSEHKNHENVGMTAMHSMDNALSQRKDVKSSHILSDSDTVIHSDSSHHFNLPFSHSTVDRSGYVTGNCTAHHVHMAQVTSLDDAMEIMVNRLKTLNLWNNTLLVFSSDNGGAFGYGDNAPLRGGKATPFEGGVRVPAFISGGYLSCDRRGQILDEFPVHATDWYRTLLSAAGLNVQHERSRRLYTGTTGNSAVDMRWQYLEDKGMQIDIDGLDLWNAIQFGIVEDALVDREILLHLDEVDCPHAACGALLSGHWKLIRGPQLCNNGNCGWNNAFMTNPEGNILGCPTGSIAANQSKVEQCADGCLFDLETDPCERTNVKEDHEDIWREMEQRLAYWQQRSVRPLMGMNVTILNNDEVRPTLVCNSDYWCPYQNYSDVLFEEQLKMEYIRLYASKMDRNGGSLVKYQSVAVALTLPDYHSTVGVILVFTVITIFCVLIRMHKEEEVDSKRLQEVTSPLLD